MQYITAKQAAAKWEITVRRVQDLCRSHQINGAVRWGRDWMIPTDAHRPDDRRKKTVTHTPETVAQLPRKNPAILMSNIYNTPGTADRVPDSFPNRPVAGQLFRSQIAFCRGEVDYAIELVLPILEKPCGHDLQIGCGMVLGLCALFKGNQILWERAKECIKTAPCHNAHDRFSVDFWLGALECELLDVNTFPIWFARGRFDVLPGDSFPSARFYYLRFIHLMGRGYALGHHGDAPDAQRAMSMFPVVAEPLIAQNKKEGALVSEIYTRLLCACSNHDIGDDTAAIHHLDIAIALALPDRLYMLLAEYRRQLDFLMDERLSRVDPIAAQQVKTLNKQFSEGWTALHNVAHNKTVSNQLTAREREVAKQAAFGLSNKDIAQRLNISVNTVKQSLRTAMDKTGALRRSDLADYI